MCNRISMSDCASHIFAAGKRFNRGIEYGLEIPAIFHFYGPEKAIKLAKN